MRRVDGVAYLQLSLHSAATAAQLPCLRASLRQCNFVLVWLSRGWPTVAMEQPALLVVARIVDCPIWLFSDDNNAPIKLVI